MIESVLQNRAIFREHRPEQVEMIHAIWRALQSTYDFYSLAVEAGCGVGKSYAELVPLILRVNELQRSIDARGLTAEEKAFLTDDEMPRAIVATASKTLQSQLVDKDLKNLSQHFNFTYMLAKGRNNYLCKHKVDRLAERFADSVDLYFVKRWKTTTGDKDELQEEFEGWEYVNCENCVGKACQYSREKDCYFTKACLGPDGVHGRRTANIVVTNHHLLAMSLLRPQHEIFGKYGIVVIDEAHKFEDALRGCIEQQISRGKIMKTMRIVRELLGYKKEPQSWNAPMDNLRAATEIYFEHIAGQVNKTRTVIPGDVSEDRTKLLVDCLGSMVSVVMRTPNPTLDVSSQDYSEMQESAVGKIEELCRNLESVHAPELGWTAYIEVSGKEKDLRHTVKLSPLSVADFATMCLFREKRRIILTSATLSTNGSFAYLEQSLGVKFTDSVVLGTPFDFRRQALFYASNNVALEKCTAEGYKEALTDEIRELVVASRGGAFILTTSHADLMYVHENLNVPWPTKRQGSMSNKELIKWFKEKDDRVLIGTKSFWEGVDIPGEGLRLVVISHIPFPNPEDPIMKGIAKQLFGEESGYRAWKALSLPRSILDLKQGVGRLIRSQGDRGVFAILDPRLFTKGYGREILKSLPPAPLTQKLSDVRDFFRTDAS